MCSTARSASICTLGIEVDHHDRIYVLESSYSTTDPFPEPATGRLVRVNQNGKKEVLLDGAGGMLSVASGMTFGPDGALYISNVGYGAPPIGLGQIIRVEVGR